MGSCSQCWGAGRRFLVWRPANKLSERERFANGGNRYRPRSFIKLFAGRHIRRRAVVIAKFRVLNVPLHSERVRIVQGSPRPTMLRRSSRPRGSAKIAHALVVYSGGWLIYFQLCPL